MKKEPEASYPFYFRECFTMLHPTGKRAANLREFLDILRDVPEGVIFHHLHQAYLSFTFHVWDYPNDFARWAARSLEDIALAEKLSNFDPYGRGSLEEVREGLIEIVEDHLWETPVVPYAPRGGEFYFCDVTTVVLSTDIVAHTLLELAEGIGRTGLSSIFYHFYEARRRLKADVDDFSTWIEENFKRPNLVQAIRSIDFYLYSLEELKQTLLKLLRLNMAMKGHEKAKDRH
jgi:hypothetical protein